MMKSNSSILEVLRNDIGQVSMAKSSIHFEYLFLLKISMEYFILSQRRSPRDIFKYGLFLRKHFQKYVISQKHISNKISISHKSHAARGSINFSNRNKLIKSYFTHHQQMSQDSSYGLQHCAEFCTQQ